MKHPVALTAYNRPAHTLAVLDALRRQGAEPLYVFCDGPKDGADAACVRGVRDIVAGIDWTEPTVVTQEENIGLARSIVGAVDYVLDRYETVILLEDDCLPLPGFLPFMRRCLDLYRDDARIFSVGGYTPPLPDEVLADYPWNVYFIHRPETWGWATWRWAWQLYERDVTAAHQAALDRDMDLGQCGNDLPGYIQRKAEGTLDVWSPGWILALYLNDGYCAYPAHPLVRNIGFDGSGTHCGVSDKYDSRGENGEPERFPPGVVTNRRIEYTVKEFYGG